MDVRIFAGKGGVGKTTAAVSTAVYLAAKGPVAIVDYDINRSVPFELGINDGGYAVNVMAQTGVKNLSMYVIDYFRFKSITEYKRGKKPTQEYMKQFPEDYGILPVCDMVTTFFGIPTDPDGLSQFVAFARFIGEVEEKGIEQVIIDVEPTGGLGRLLKASSAIKHSIENLRHPIKLIELAVRLGWPDIHQYYTGNYVRNTSASYLERFERASEVMAGANYFIVCNPQKSPVHQMKTILRIMAEYDAGVRAFVVNKKTKRDVKIMEEVGRIAQGLPILLIPFDNGFDEAEGQGKIELLRKTGESLAIELPSEAKLLPFRLPDDTDGILGIDVQEFR